MGPCHHEDGCIGGKRRRNMSSLLSVGLRYHMQQGLCASGESINAKNIGLWLPSTSWHRKCAVAGQKGCCSLLVNNSCVFKCAVLAESLLVPRTRVCHFSGATLAVPQWCSCKFRDCALVLSWMMELGESARRGARHGLRSSPLKGTYDPLE